MKLHEYIKSQAQNEEEPPETKNTSETFNKNRHLMNIKNKCHLYAQKTGSTHTGTKIKNKQLPFR
jgi:hypothetical protein